MSEIRESPFAYLRRVREERRWSLRQVQRVAQISPGYLSLIETGERPMPGLELLRKLARLYEIPLPEFYRGLGLMDEAEAAEWRPRRGDVVLVEGRDRADVLLSDPDQRMALVRTRLGERFEKAWSLLAPEAQEVAA